jgi:hypothetical protein
MTSALLWIALLSTADAHTRNATHEDGWLPPGLERRDGSVRDGDLLAPPDPDAALQAAFFGSWTMAED